ERKLPAVTKNGNYPQPVKHLKPLVLGHAPAVLAFELVNRAYFAASVSDRGDEFFDQFPGRYSALLAEREAGVCPFYVLVADDGSVLGVDGGIGWSSSIGFWLRSLLMRAGWGPGGVQA